MKLSPHAQNDYVGGRAVSIVGDLVKLYEVWGSWKDQHATDAEKELLAKSLPTGMIEVLSTDQTGEFIRVGGHAYLDQNDPSVQARALEAMEKAIRRGWIRHEEGILFKLSGTGFDRAREYAKELGTT
jgi:hypothetical protein